MTLGWWGLSVVFNTFIRMDTPQDFPNDSLNISQETIGRELLNRFCKRSIIASYIFTKKTMVGKYFKAVGDNTREHVWLEFQ